MEDIVINKEFMEQYSQLNFQRIKEAIIKDLNSNYQDTVILRKYTKDQIAKYLDNPDKAEKQLWEMSDFLYNVSEHYKRLIDYMAKLATDNYFITPEDILTDDEKYIEVAKKYKKCNFKTINKEIRHEVFLKGIYCGIINEVNNSFYLRKLDIQYCKVSAIADGVPIFSFNLDYFNVKARFNLLEQYGKDFVKAYYDYKGDPERNIPPNRELKWFEPKNQICVKADMSTFDYSLPYFTGLFEAVLEIDVFKEIKKDRAILDNYKVLAMEMPTDEYGVPKMEYEKAKRYYNQAAAVLPDGIGLILSPFPIKEFTLQNTGESDQDLAENAVKQFWNNAGVSPLLFGIGDRPASAVLELNIRTDEAVVFNINDKIAKSFNVDFKRKLKNQDIMFFISFLPQSLFNQDRIVDSFVKACSYGLPLKSQLMASYGLEPIDVLSMCNLEDNILGFTKTCLNTPLLQSSTMSPDSENGRPSNAETGKTDSDSTESGRDNNTENR